MTDLTTPLLEVDKIEVVEGFNPRTHMDPDALARLAGNLGNVGLDHLGEFQQTKMLAHPAIRDVQLLGNLFVGRQVQLGGQLREAAGRVDRVEVLAVEVL